MRRRTTVEGVQIRAEAELVGKGSGELEGAFFVEPNVSDKEDTKKNKHGRQRECRKMLSDPPAKQDGPGKQEDGFHVEDHEEHSNDVEAGGVAAASAGFREDAAFVRLKFRWAAAGARADVFEDDQGNDGERENEQGEEEKRDVGGWHSVTYGRMLTQIQDAVVG